MQLPDLGVVNPPQSRQDPRHPIAIFRPRVIAPEKAVETLCHPITVVECASNIMRKRSDARKGSSEHPGSVLETISNYVRHSLRCSDPLKDLSVQRPSEHARWPTSIDTPKGCVTYSSHASFKAHSPQSDTLHLNMLM